MHQRGGKSLSIGAAVNLCRCIAEALCVVDEAGLSHRDLKPDNVVLAPRDRVVLMDFSLTRPEALREHFAGGVGGPTKLGCLHS